VHFTATSFVWCQHLCRGDPQYPAPTTGRMMKSIECFLQCVFLASHPFLDAFCPLIAPCILSQYTLWECKAASLSSNSCDCQILSLLLGFLFSCYVWRHRLNTAKPVLNSDCSTRCPTTKHNWQVRSSIVIIQQLRLSDPQHRCHPTVAMVRSSAFFALCFIA
jgi:hypothetical protein